MLSSRSKTIFRNVAPAILANACVFLFSVVDGIFVGRGVGMQALGAVNLALPFVLIVHALNAMASIGGVTITAIRFGRGDKEGAQNAFMHAVTTYFYSTKRSGQAIALNVVRSLVLNSLVMTLLPLVFGRAIVWHTFGIYEILVLIVAVALKIGSERKGIIYK